MYKIAKYFLKNQERTQVLLIAFGVAFLTVFLIFGNAMDQAMPTGSLTSEGIRKVIIYAMSFIAASPAGVWATLKISRFFDRIQTEYIIR